MLGAGDVDYSTPTSATTRPATSGSGCGAGSCSPSRPTRARPPRPSPDLADHDPDHGQRRRQRGRQDVHDHHPQGASGTPARPPGDRRRRGARCEAHLQPGPAVRRHAGLRGPHRGLQDSSATVSPRWAKTPSAIANYIDTTPLPGVVAKDDQTVVFTLTQPGHVLRRHADPARLLAGSGRGAQRTCRAAPSSAKNQISNGPYKVDSVRADQGDRLLAQPGVERVDRPGPQGVRRQDRGRTRRSARTRSSSSCRPAPPTADMEFDVRRRRRSSRA